MYVCMYVCVCMYICMYVCMYVWMYVCLSVCADSIACMRRDKVDEVEHVQQNTQDAALFTTLRAFMSHATTHNPKYENACILCLMFGHRAAKQLFVENVLTHRQSSIVPLAL